MSFILDALKKSELERQRQAAPGLIEAATLKARPRFPPWAIALAALLTVNLLVLAFVASRSGLIGRHELAATPAARGLSPATLPSSSPTHAAPPAARASAVAGDNGAGAASSAAGTTANASRVANAGVPASTGVPANTGVADGNAHFSPMEGAPEYAPEIPVAQNETPAISPPAPHPARAHEKPFQPPAPVDEGPPDEVLPSISEINMTGPELHLDVHVYATQPAERFVYINMRRYHEGQVLEEGPTVERIRRDGVVLSYQGIRFLLPRQR